MNWIFLQCLMMGIYWIFIGQSIKRDVGRVWYYLHVLYFMLYKLKCHCSQVAKLWQTLLMQCKVNGLLMRCMGCTETRRLLSLLYFYTHAQTYTHTHTMSCLSRDQCCIKTQTWLLSPTLTVSYTTSILSRKIKYVFVSNLIREKKSFVHVSVWLCDKLMETVII